MDAGQLDQSILIEVPTPSTNALGEEVLAWSTHSTPRAKAMETPGREFLKGDYRAEEKAVFVIRWRDIDSTARVQWGGRVWDITSITGTRREGWQYLHAITTEGAN